jgi:YD repeat-containing protein
MRLNKYIALIIVIIFLWNKSIFSQNVPDFVGHKNYYSHLNEINKKLKIKSRARVVYYKNQFANCVKGCKIEQYYYDSKGDIIEINCFIYDNGNLKISERYICSYDTNDNITKYILNGLEQKYIYDKSGNIKESTTKNESNEIMETSKYIMNNNRVEKSQTINIKGEIINDQEYIYNKEGNLTLIKCKDYYNTYNEMQFYYDNNNNLIREYSTFNKMSTIYYYDSDNKIIEGYSARPSLIDNSVEEIKEIYTYQYY